MLIQLISAVLSGSPPDVIDFTGGSKSTSSPSTFSMNADGSHSSLTGDSSWETENNPNPQDTYHIKWEDHTTLLAPNVTPFAKSTWTQLTGAGPFTWQTTASAPDVITRGMAIHISNDGGTTTLANADVSMTADETP